MQKDIVTKELRTGPLLKGDCLDLVKGLLEKNQDNRLGANGGVAEIKQHAFFSGLNWDDVFNKRTKHDRQFLKIDMINSNFNQDTGNDAFDIGIEVEEECNYEDEQGAH